MIQRDPPHTRGRRRWRRPPQLQYTFHRQLCFFVASSWRYCEPLPGPCRQPIASRLYYVEKLCRGSPAPSCSPPSARLWSTLGRSARLWHTHGPRCTRQRPFISRHQVLCGRTCPCLGSRPRTRRPLSRCPYRLLSLPAGDLQVRLCVHVRPAARRVGRQPQMVAAVAGGRRPSEPLPKRRWHGTPAAAPEPPQPKKWWQGGRPAPQPNPLPR